MSNFSAASATTVVTGLLLLAGCGKQAPTEAPAPAAPVKATFDTSISNKQLMAWIVDPSSKVVFSAVASIVTEKGEEQIQPHTDEEWNNVRNHAAIVLEAGNLLLLEGRAKDSEDWMAKARAMSAAARTAIEATDVKDPDALFIASGDIYQACTDCHAKYIFQPAPDSAK